jgi:hypothetical protein
MYGQDLWHIGGREEVYTGFWWGNLKESDPLKDLGINSRIILNAIRRHGLD